MDIHTDYRLQELLGYYKRELDSVNAEVAAKPWLRSMHYIAERDACESHMNQAACDVADYLLEKISASPEEASREE